MNEEINTIHLRIIKEYFPDMLLNNVKQKEGNDHVVYIVNGKVFRFPKKSREIVPKRANFLKQLAKVSPIAVPVISIKQDAQTGIWYEVNEYIPGISCSPDLIKKFSYNDKMEIAKKFGNFLNVLHTFPIDEARKLSLDEMNPNDFGEYMEQNAQAYPKFKRLVFPYVSNAEQEWIETLFSEYIVAVKKRPFEIKVTHADMWLEHIIIDQQKHTLSGIIDYWGRIADPANDFKAFEYFGRAFVDEVYKHYGLSVDEGFEKRRLFYTGHDHVFELARQIEQSNAEQIEKQKVLLSAYIESHPMHA